MIRFQLFLLFIGLLSCDATAIAQVSGFRGSVGGRSSLGGAQGFSGRAVNPNFNPRGSLSTFQNLNPRGSLSPALNLNPQGSLLRPRTGGTAGATRGAAGSIAGTTARYTTYKVPFEPTYKQLRFLPRSSLTSWSAVGLEQFESSLHQYKNGEVWRSYLNLHKIKSMLQSASEQPLDESSRTQLNGMLERFDTVSDEGKYSEVKLLPGFRTSRSSLRELVRADSGDDRDRLIRSAMVLNQVLKDSKGGNAWQEFLALPGLIKADAEGDSESQVSFLAACKKTDERFEKVLGLSGEYRRITEMPEFQATYENLKSILQKTEDSQSNAATSR